MLSHSQLFYFFQIDAAGAIWSYHWFYKAQCGLIYSSITALHCVSNCLSDSRYSSAWPSHQRCRDVRCKSALSVGEASSLRNGQDLPLHFHCSLIKSLLRPNQQVCSRLVSGFLPYPQGLWNEGQWVCYCFSLPLYPLIALWCQQWSDRESWALEKKNPREEITAIMIPVRASAGLLLFH